MRQVLEHSGAAALADAAQLAVSEVITNALVHAGAPIHLRVAYLDTRLRVEVADGSPTFPSPRDYTSLAGTGRGLTLLDDSVDRWGVFAHGDGKLVWFEIGAAGGAADPSPGTGRTEDADRATVQVELHNVPLLMHAAWQEHAAALLRDFLLLTLEDDPDALELHAQASEALGLLRDQLPTPEIGDDAEAIMAAAVEPEVSSEVSVLAVPRDSVAHFETLDHLMDRAVAAADGGLLLVPATQPEVQEMRAWLCRQVREQSLDQAAPAPWAARTDVRRPVDGSVVTDWDPQQVFGSDRALLAADESSIVVAVSRAALALLGFSDAGELVGRRVIAIIPPRFRQAHIAGTTLHSVNGRAPLLGARVTVPVLLADGSEQAVDLRIDAHRRSAGRKVFIAEFFPPDPRARP